MSDASSLRSLLRKTDASAAAIQATAGSMMRHYDKSAGVAVVEWRNALHQARTDQHLPLLYVANEVLQNSKRNRGNKFLESFSPVLGQSLIFMSQNASSPNVVEKVRRTVKIWGDRHVFSIRFVNELLKGLEPYRNGGGGGDGNSRRPASAGRRSSSGHNSSSASSMSTNRTVPSPSNSPSSPSLGTQHTPTSMSTSTPASTSSMDVDSPRGDNRTKNENSTSSSASSNGANIGNDGDVSGGGSGGGSNDGSGTVQRNDNADDDSAGDLFADSGDRLLNIDLDLDQAAATAAQDNDDDGVDGSSNGKRGGNRKRRRPSTINTTGTGRGSGPGGGSSSNDGTGNGNNSSSTGNTKSPRRRSILSTNSLMELWNQVSTLQQSYDHVQALLSDINPEFLDESTVTDQLDMLVGDELLKQYKQVIAYEKRVVEQRKELYHIAQKRRKLEREAVRYLSWLENSLVQDNDDITFCDRVLQQLQTVQKVHRLAKSARDERAQEELRLRLEEEALLQKKEEEEERKKFMESAMSKVTEAKPGMVWNKATGEYQYLETDESWRDF